ncbi:MAG: CBS-domain-containing membrane protein [Pirellulaceae bacterium]|jgi:CBS-domain-containing membrane protein
MQISIVSRLESLIVADVMAGDVCCVSSNDTLEEAAKLFIRKGVSAAPVIDEQGFCVGIISATDLLRNDCAAQSSESLLLPVDREEEIPDPSGYLEHFAKTGIEDEYVCRFMTRCIQTVSQFDGILQAAYVMDAQHIHRLPVLDSFGHPIGIVSTMDIVSALLNSIDEAKSRAL